MSSISAVRTQIALARQDGCITSNEVDKIVAAGKRNLTDDEKAPIRDLYNDIKAGKLVAENASITPALTRALNQERPEVTAYVKKYAQGGMALPFMPFMLAIDANDSGHKGSWLAIAGAALLGLLLLPLTIITVPVAAGAGLIVGAHAKYRD